MKKDFNCIYMLYYPAYLLKNTNGLNQYYYESLSMIYERGAISKCFFDFCVNRLYNLTK